MRPLDFYDLGVEMAETAQTEAQERTAINRLYYGLHHEACCRYFRKVSWAQPLNRNRRHTDLRNRLNQSVDPLSSKVAQLLGQLMRLRGFADYQISPPYRFHGRTGQQSMHMALDVSKRLVSALEGYSPGQVPDGCECRDAYSTG
jgi:hypothetical protein